MRPLKFTPGSETDTGTENFVDPDSHTHGKTIREENTVYSATGDGKIPWISAADIAACGYQLLTQENAPNDDYLILGPDLLSYGDVCLPA